MADESDNLATYASLLKSVSAGMVRVVTAHVASRELHALGFTVHAVRRQDEESGRDSGGLVAEICKMAPELYLDTFWYVSNISHLIYATTILDSFLTDTTRFLFLLHPRALGKDRAVSIEAVMNASTLSALIRDAVAKRVREIGHEKFVRRIEILCERFGLDLELAQEVRDGLDHYSSIRNAVIHDQGYQQLELSDSGALTVSRKACPRHPTPVSDEDLESAIRAYVCTCRALYSAVATGVLNGAGRKPYEASIAEFAEHEELLWNIWKHPAA